jgi:signal transduction histidine kinase
MAYARWRRFLGSCFDRMFLAHARQRAILEAVEQERARLARQLHNEPLHDLGGAIRRLELLPEAAGETSLLRSVAQHLREIATELYPPVLEDLGLGPGLAFLSDQASGERPTTPVRTDVVDEIGLEFGRRLPRDIELAAYRIAQEAIANAQLADQATQIDVEGRIAPDSLALTVRDNGVGLSESIIRDAERRGHLGMATMRQRAALIGAVLEVRRQYPRGTVVSLRWRPKR